jgi:hypothetical protein
VRLLAAEERALRLKAAVRRPEVPGDERQGEPLRFLRVVEQENGRAEGRDEQGGQNDDDEAPSDPAGGRREDRVEAEGESACRERPSVIQK